MMHHTTSINKRPLTHCDSRTDSERISKLGSGTKGNTLLLSSSLKYLPYYSKILLIQHNLEKILIKIIVGGEYVLSMIIEVARWVI